MAGMSCVTLFGTGRIGNLMCICVTGCRNNSLSCKSFTALCTFFTLGKTGFGTGGFYSFKRYFAPS